MAEITASMVKELRDRTDAPMMECKKALTEAGGDPGKAEEILRVKLGNKANKAASRVAAEGAVAAWVSVDGKTGALIEVNSETDFVAKNPDFLAFTARSAELAAKDAPADVAALGNLKDGGGTLDEARRALVGKLGENVTVRRFARVAAQGKLVTYIHGGAKVGVLLDIAGGDEALGKDIAMHIAAIRPAALSRDQVPVEAVEKERRIAAEKAAESGKPPEIVAKMVEGSVQKFLKEATLLGQPFVKDDKQTIEQLLKARGAQVHAFHLYVVGEGIEKKKDDFAAEVKAQAEAARAASGAAA